MKITKMKKNKLKRKASFGKQKEKQPRNQNNFQKLYFWLLFRVNHYFRTFTTIMIFLMLLTNVNRIKTKSTYKFNYFKSHYEIKKIYIKYMKYLF